MQPKALQPIHHALSPQDAATVAAIRAQTAAFKGSTFGPEGRAAYDTIMNAVPGAENVRYEAAQVGGVPGFWVRPAQASPSVAVLFLHGGGYVMGSAGAYCNFAGHFAQRLQADVFLADYRLGPEHPFPAALEDALAAYQGLADTGASQLLVIGDSAGGGLSLSLLSRLNMGAAAALPRPAAAALMSPWTDLTLSGASLSGKAEEELYLSPAMVKACAAMYLGSAPASHPQATVLNADLNGLPPMQIHVGTCEILLDDALRYAQLAHAAGNEVGLHVWEGMPHVFPNCPGMLQAANTALDTMSSFLAAHLRS